MTPHRSSSASPGVPLIRRAEGKAPDNPRISIATLVSDRTHYDAMRASFEAGGFDPADCEYLFVDNTGPEQTEAYGGLNGMLNAARAPIVVLCHQDVRLLSDGREALEARLAELARLDPDWALAGNAGGVAPGRLALRISDPHGKNQRVGTLPAKVVSLDENFIVVRREARIGFSRDLKGFHFYGADICLQAAQAGYCAYVVDFHLQHLSGGKKGADFAAAEAAFRAKWSRALTPRWVQTTCSLVHLSGGPIGGLLGRVVDERFAKLARRLPHAQGWKKPGRAPV